MYKFKKIVGKPEFSDQFSKLVIRYKRKGYKINVLKQSAHLAVNPNTFDHFAYLFNCTPMGQGSESMMILRKHYSVNGLGQNILRLFVGSPVLN